MADGIGLSIGSAYLTAVHVGRAAVRRSAVLTRYPHRPPEVGVPSENPNLAERGLILTDFVDRVGDPVPILAPDGSSHRAEVVVADALRAMLLTLLGGRPATEPVGIAYPAHWRPAAVEALRQAIASVPEFRTPVPALLVSDAAAALIALQHEPGVPARGVIAVCDFGATGTSITVADAANGFAPIGPTVRDVDLSGELVDQALLTQVIGALTAGGTVDVTATSAIGSLGRLRSECRAAKERLSTTTVTSMPVDLPGAGGEVRVTRIELDDAIRSAIDGFASEVQDTLQQNGVRASDLVAVASVGGGARIPIVTTTLSEHLRVPVISAPTPELAAAIGGGLRAIRGTVEESATSMAPVPVPPVPFPPAESSPAAAEPPMSKTFRALAWSDADDVPDVAPSEPYGGEFGGAEDAGYNDPGAVARPSMAFDDPDPVEDDRAAAVPWYRRPVAIIAGAVLLVLLIIGAAVAFVSTGDEEGADPVETSTATATTPPPASPVAPGDSPSEPAQAPESQTVTESAPPPVAESPPPPGEPPPAPPPESPPPAAEPPPAPSSEAPPPSPSPPPPSSSPPPPVSPPYSTVPGLPFVPAPPAIPGIPQPVTP